MADVSVVEETFRRLGANKGVEGVLVLNGDSIPIRSTMDNSQSVKYAGWVSQRPSLRKHESQGHDSSMQTGLRNPESFCQRSFHCRYPNWSGSPGEPCRSWTTQPLPTSWPPFE